MALESSPSRTRFQASARAGVGLRARFLREKARRPDPSWPPDWWQRNYDLLYEMNASDPIPYTERMQRIPPASGQS